MMRIAVIGHGAMGCMIEELSPQVGADVVAVYDVDRPFALPNTAGATVAIDFSLPHVVRHNVQTACQAGMNIVIGTTGWYDELPEITQLANDAGIGIIYGTNFSVGIHLFLRLVDEAAKLVNDNPSYDVMLHEWHHHRKQDSPSGTALTAANVVLRSLERKHHLVTETQHGAIDAGALHVSSTRGGEVVGRHTLTIDSSVDTIEITHNAKNRQGFALGALRAAAWLQGKKGVYDFADVVTQLK